MPFAVDISHLSGITASGQTATDTTGVQIPPIANTPDRKYTLFLFNDTTTRMTILINSGGQPVMPLVESGGNLTLNLGRSRSIYVKADSGTPNVNWGTWTI